MSSACDSLHPKLPHETASEKANWLVNFRSTIHKICPNATRGPLTGNCPDLAKKCTECLDNISIQEGIHPEAYADATIDCVLTNKGNELSGGAVAGVIIGLVLVFILLLWLLKIALGGHQLSP
jgi:hypothetical protein